MARPTLVPIAGQFLKVDGTPESGTLAFQSDVLALYSSDSIAQVPSDLQITLDENGEFTELVPATNDPAWTPAGWKYRLIIRFTETYAIYDVSVPYDAGSLTLAELIPVQPNQPTNPANYAPLVHNHAAADIVSGTIAMARLPVGLTHDHVAYGDHTHSGGGSGPIAIDDVTGLTAALNGKAASVHTHTISDVTNLQTTLNGKANTSSLAAVATSGSYNDLSNKPAIPTIPVTSVAGKTGDVSLVKADVGLGNVDNTADSGKPVSTATQTALNLKANLASPTFTGTVSGISKSMVGLGNVDNISDANKPISTATQTALDLKASVTSVTSVSDRVTAVEDMTPVVMLWNGTAYVEAGSARVYVGPNDPGVVPNGSVWVDTTP